MKTIIKTLVFCAGLGLMGCGLYFGLWICFLGGISDVINACKLPVTSAGDIAFGIGKVLITGVVTALGVGGGGLLCGFAVFGLFVKRPTAAGALRDAFAASLKKRQRNLKVSDDPAI